MSTLKADTIVASDGTSPVTLTKQSAAKAYATVDAEQTTTGTTSSFNISSTTDDGTGLWDNAFTNNMSSTPYSVAGISTGGADSDAFVRAVHIRATQHTDTTPSSMLTSGVGFKGVFAGSTQGVYGYAYNSFEVLGDLA